MENTKTLLADSLKAVSNDFQKQRKEREEVEAVYNYIPANAKENAI